MMGVIYQLTFFLALGLLAIVITIFVFAVAQLGRAIEMSSKQQQDVLLKQKEAKTKQIEKIEKRVAKAKKTGDLDETKLLQDLQGLREESAKYGTELEYIEEKLERLQVKGGVLRPGAFFVTTLILSGLAIFLAEGQNHIAIPLWGISIAALCYGGWEVYKNLKVIEEVTITSQEAVEKLPEAVKAALRELEEEKKPELELIFRDEQPPLVVEAESETSIAFNVGLSKGNVARNTEFFIIAPPGFEFPDSAKGPGLSGTYRNYVSAMVELGDIRTPLKKRRSVKLKAPSKPNRYTAAYRLICDGFDSGFIEFEIIVKETELPF